MASSRFPGFLRIKNERAYQTRIMRRYGVQYIFDEVGLELGILSRLCLRGLSIALALHFQLSIFYTSGLLSGEVVDL